MKTKKQKLRSQADALYSKAFLRKNCEVCGKLTTCVHHFYYKRSYPHLRYSKANAITLCVSCHFTLHHKDPKLVSEKIIAKKGSKWYIGIKEASRERPASFQTVGWYEDIIEELNEIVIQDMSIL